MDVELIGFDPSAAFFENDNIVKFSRAIDDLREMAKQAEQIEASESKSTSEEIHQQRQAWLDDLHNRTAIADAFGKGGPMALEVGASFSSTAHSVEVFRQQIEGLLRGVDVTLWQQMQLAGAKIEVFEDSEVANRYLASTEPPDFENCGGQAFAMAKIESVDHAYMAGDIGRLGDIINVVVCFAGKVFALETRNDAWAQRVLQSRPQRGLVVVGIAHLYDPSDTMSMLHVFAKNGYEVEPVELKPTLPAAHHTLEEVGQDLASLTLRRLRGIGGGIGFGI